VKSTDRFRQFRLSTPPGTRQVERYYFSYGRYLGANKHFNTHGTSPDLRFAVWAPNASNVEVVFGLPGRGYIADDGSGIDTSRPPVSMQRQPSGIWESSPQADFAAQVGLPYMYRVSNAQGSVVYRTDIFSRQQIGRGADDPATQPWPGTIDTLDGTISCSVVVDADSIAADFGPPAASTARRIPDEEFWAHEFTPGLAVPTSIQDLVVYELHVGSLGFGNPNPGTLADALAFLDHLASLGVNAVELLPLAQFNGVASWGYGDSHHMAIQASEGGRDEYRYFVRECHRRGIAVIQDVVYNHYDAQASRAEWQYDSVTPEQNIYYWYEGRSSDYPRADGGYLDNGSSGWAPRYWEEVVRQQFITSAAVLVEEMHVDGLRVDLTQAMHRDNQLHADGRSVGSANVFGQKLLREWSRTLRMIHPTVFLVAEDHTGWDAVTKPPAAGGLGFNVTWDADFYHHLVGGAEASAGHARLVKQAGMGGNEPLAMDWFAGALSASPFNKVVYHQNHDEAGNDRGSARTIVTAVNGAALVGATRVAAEARCRVGFGLSLLSAGTPMFLMAEETGAAKPFTFDGFLQNREDIRGERAGQCALLFRYYQELISLGRRMPSIRSQNLRVVHVSNANRVIVFKRWTGLEEVLVFASLNNTAFNNGYIVQADQLSIPNALWKEIFNSDAAIYGGDNVGNGGASILASGGRLAARIPANGLLVFVRQ
jgi:1,4-alpha-glucan branching enzyme